MTDEKDLALHKLHHKRFQILEDALSKLNETQSLMFSYAISRSVISDHTIGALMSLSNLLHPEEKDTVDLLSKVHVKRLNYLDELLLKKDLKGIEKFMSGKFEKT